MELDADEPRKFQGPPDRILGPADMGGGGGGGAAQQNFGCEDSLWRDLSALGFRNESIQCSYFDISMCAFEPCLAGEK